MLFNIETFTQKRPNRNDLKKFHHVEILGFKFRIAVNERQFKQTNTKWTRKYNPNNRNLYRTNRGWVWNRNPKKYYCLITK